MFAYQYDEYFEPERPSCRQCEESQQKLDDAKEFLEGVVEKLYSRDTLDVLHLEFLLDELCFYLDVKSGIGDLQIQRLS